MVNSGALKRCYIKAWELFSVCTLIGGKNVLLAFVLVNDANIAGILLKM
jgi:hypothetical protein